MLTRSFSIGEVLKLGWTKFKAQPFTWILALLLMVLVLGTHPFVNSWILGHGFTINLDDFDISWDEMDSRTQILTILTSIIYALIQTGLGLGLTYMSLRAADGLKIHLGHLFARFQYVFHYLIAYFLYSLVILVGLILLVFPAAIWGSRYSLFPFFIVDQGAGPIESLKKSSEATYGAKWDIFGLLLISLCLGFVGAILAFLGLFVVIPVLSIAWASAYRYLTMPKAQQETTFIQETATTRF